MTKRTCDPAVPNRYLVLKIPIDINRQLCSVTVDTNKSLNAKIMQYIIQGLEQERSSGMLPDARKERRMLKSDV